MKQFNLEEVHANKPFEVYFAQLGWIKGSLLQVRKLKEGEGCSVKVAFASFDTHEDEWFLLPNDRLRMKEE